MKKKKMVEIRNYETIDDLTSTVIGKVIELLDGNFDGHTETIQGKIYHTLIWFGGMNSESSIELNTGEKSHRIVIKKGQTADTHYCLPENVSYDIIKNLVKIQVEKNAKSVVKLKSKLFESVLQDLGID